MIAVDARVGLGPALATVGFDSITYDFLFTEPHDGFEVSRQGELPTRRARSRREMLARRTT